MPPRLRLDVDCTSPAAPAQTNSSQQAQQNSQAQSDLSASLSLGDNGTLRVVSKSFQEFKFTSDGMTRITPRNASPAPGDQTAYKLAEKDVHIFKVLGRGASSVVQKAFYPRGNCFVAVKKINIFEKEMRHQMMNDVKALCDAPDEPGLVRFIGAYHSQESGQIAIVLEYMDGGSLADVVQQVGKIPENILAKITLQVLRGLIYLHKNKHTVHRDIKPANILVSLDGEAKISDFGISAFVDNTLAVCNTFLGTVTYMSPERIHSDRYSFPADIWSLGLTLLECALGRYPYDASVGPLQLMIQVVEEPCPLPEGEFSPELRDLIRACMDKDPLKRPTAEGMLSHPFLMKYAQQKIDLKAFLECVHNPYEKLDEIAIIYTTKYYSLLSEGKSGLPSLAPLYTDESIVTYDGLQTRGRAKVMQKLKSVVDMHAAFGKAEHKVQSLDCLPLGTSVLVHVRGTIEMKGAVALGQGAVSSFAESFVLAQMTKGEYYVANQAFRLLN